MRKRKRHHAGLLPATQTEPNLCNKRKRERKRDDRIKGSEKRDPNRSRDLMLKQSKVTR
jgi:hypothetical protein